MSTLLPTTADDNLLAGLHVPPSDLQVERHLFQTKWFDYRFITPVKATELFREKYSEAYRAKWRRHADLREAELKTGVREVGLFGDRGELTSFWRARQFADEQGMPYGMFLDWALDGFLDTTYQRIPRPNQLYGKKVRGLVARGVQAKWTELRADRLMYSTLAEYRNESFIGLPAQIDHHNWVVEQVRLRHGSPYLIAKVCFHSRVLPVERATEAFGAERVERAHREAMVGEPADEALSACALQPGCFGVPHVVNVAVEPCAQCSLSSTCEVQAAACRLEVLDRCGSLDPIGDRKRAQTRARVARHRASRTAVMSVSSPPPS